MKHAVTKRKELLKRRASLLPPAQIMYSTIKGDFCMGAAYSNELPGFGCKVTSCALAAALDTRAAYCRWGRPQSAEGLVFNFLGTSFLFFCVL